MFCLLAPNGQDWLTRADRGPQMVLGRRAGSEEMERYSLQYPPTADVSEALVQDFHSFRQALNVASADQRVLVVVNVDAEVELELRQSLRTAANDPQVVGRFHFDFEQGEDWKENIEGTSTEAGIVLINPGEFGLKGTVMKQLPADSSKEQILGALAEANSEFAATTKKKVYSEHVSKGRAAGVYFEGAVPYGEDRDGDGQVDRGGSGRGGAGGRGGSRRGS
ncbi:MAG: hypothetical protein AB8B91_25315 [Rubripirellula sp.]